MKLWSQGAAGKIAATATALAVTGAFGVGAYALTQDGAVFDPSGFTSAYGKGANDTQKGYQATPESTDAAANRHNDESDNNDRSAEENPSKDAFSELPNNGKGTTAVAVDANAKPGTSTVVDDPGAGGSDNGSGSGSAGNPTGPVIDNGGNGSSGDDSGNSGGDNGDSGNNGGSTTPGNPGGNGNGGGNSGGGSGTTPGGPDSGAGGGSEKPAEEEPITNPITPSKEVDDPEKIAGSTAETGQEMATIFFPASGIPCANEKVTPWDLFCALDTSYILNGSTYYWAWSNKDTFDKYELFKVTGIEYEQNGKKVVDAFDENNKTLTIPNGPFTVTYKYRYAANSDFKEGSAEVVKPAVSRTLIVCQTVSQDGSTIEKAVKSIPTFDEGTTINLAEGSFQLLKEADCATFQYAPVKKYIRNWREGSTVLPDELYTPERGYHVITADLEDAGPYEIQFTTRYFNKAGNYTEDVRDATAVYLQTLVGVKASDQSAFATFSLAATESAAVANGETLHVPRGIQEIKFDKSNPYEVDKLSLPSTVRYIDMTNGALVVRDRFEVDSDNAIFTASDDGVLFDKDMTECVGVPSEAESLRLPDGVTKVTLPKQNSLKEIIIEADEPQNIPVLPADCLSQGCSIVLSKEALGAFQKKNPAVVENGNEIKIGDKHYELKDGLTVCDGSLGNVVDNGLPIVTLYGIKNIESGSFSSNSSAHIVFLDGANDCTFERECFDNGAITTVVCNTEKQAQAVKASLGEGSIVDVVVKSEGAKQTSDGRFSYLIADGTTILLQANTDDIVTFDGKLEDGLVADAIGPNAFANNSSLRYVDLNSSVKTIALQAFNGCSNLKEVLIEAPDSIALGARAFQNCNSLEIFASNAAQALGNTKAIAAIVCEKYCPTNYAGYEGGFTYFLPSTNVTSYTAATQADGSFVLYANTGDEQWLCLAAPSELPKSVVLPSSTIEIFSSAFANARCGLSQDGFTINFDNLNELYCIDDCAFSNSDLSGDVHLIYGGNNTFVIDDEAFEGCKIASITSNSSYLSVKYAAFTDCKQLESVSLACGSSQRSSIQAGSWYGCDNLKSIAFTNDSSAPQLTKFTRTAAYYFADSEYDSQISISVPTTAKMAYLRDWLYAFSSYNDYEDLCDSARFDLLFELCEEPTEARVIERANETILATENKLRTMMGMETVDTPTFDHKEIVDGVVFKVDESGQASVVDVEYGVDAVDFTQIDTSRWTEISLQEDAFSNAADTLRSVVLSDKVKVIRSGAFDGCRNITVTLADSVPLLYGGSLAGQFDFGAANLKLAAADEVRQQCLESWPRQMLGLDTDKALDDYVLDVYSSLVDWDSGTAPTKSQVSNAVNEKLREQENRIREWFGMRALESNEAPIWAYDSPYGADDVLSDVEDEEGDRAIADGDAAESDPNEEDTNGKEEQSGESGSAGNAPGGNKGANEDPTGTGTNDANAATPEPPTPETPTESEDATTE